MLLQQNLIKKKKTSFWEYLREIKMDIREVKSLYIKPIQSSTMQEKVYEELLQAILSGKLPPGETITMEGLAAMLNISLTPVRAALKKLEAGNFITIGRNRRIKVTQLSQKNLLEILDARLLLECHAAKMACIKRNEGSLKLLERINRKCDQAMDGDAYLKANYQFHSLIYKESKMEIITNLIDTLWQQMSPYLHILLRTQFSHTISDAGSFHKGIIEAMRNKDKQAIIKWLSCDLTHAAELIKQDLD